MAGDSLRVLVVEDLPALDEAAGTERRKDAESPLVEALRDVVLGPPDEPHPSRFEIDVCGAEHAATRVAAAKFGPRPYAVVFVHLNASPDGAATVERLWTIDGGLHCVLCRAPGSERDDALERLRHADRLLLLETPFQPIEAQQVARALSAKAQLERRARTQCESLETLVRERTEQLEIRNSDLTAALVRAETAGRAKSDFLTNMSHEVRTPMTAILGYADLLREPELDLEPRLGYVRAIQRAGERLLHLVDDLLDLAHAEAGRLEVQTAELDLHGLLHEVAAAFDPAARERGLELELALAPAFPVRIVSDARRVRQVLQHLVDNAIKFTQRGNVRIAGRRIGPSRVAIDVIDSGVGMRREELARVFEAFGQLDSSTRRCRGGTGRGLPLAKRVAERLGGRIAVQSRPGLGSRFTFELETGAAAPALPAGALPAHGGAAARLELRTLLVEDSRDNQLLISTYLRRAGAEVTIACDGEEGLARAVEAPQAGAGFELVVSDMQMPRMDGYELARELRRRGFEVPILAVTAHALAGDRERCLEAGCDEYLSKPVDRGMLVVTCAALVQRVGGKKVA
jgi:signal transduction histidine kinase/ActR/RegA family two-component response regulator